MSRPRKRDRHLPPYVRIKSGAYYYRGRKVCRVDAGESKLYDELAKLKAMPSIDMIPAAVATFKQSYLKTLSPSAQREHERLLDVFANEFAEFRVDQVKAIHVRKSVHNLYGSRGKLDAARHYKSRISRFFRWCVEEAGLREENPCREVWVEKPPKKRTKWTPALFWAVREKLHEMMQCYHDLSYLLYQRTTDIRTLKRSQIRDGVIRFAPSKTLGSSGAAVDIPITPAIAAVLERAKALAKVQPGPGGDAYVIQTPDGSAYTKTGVYSAYRRADKALHEDEPIGLNPKGLRPFAATEAKKRGYTKEQIQVGLAHTTIGTTEGYIHAHEIPVSVVTMELPEKP